jgi:Stage II sporulation protein E (SpoIIE)
MSALAGIVLALLAPAAAPAITTPKLPLPVPVPTVQVPLPLPLPVPVVPSPVPTVRLPDPTPTPTRVPVAAPTPAATPAPAGRPSVTPRPATIASTPAPTAAPQRRRERTVSEAAATPEPPRGRGRTPPKASPRSRARDASSPGRSSRTPVVTPPAGGRRILATGHAAPAPARRHDDTHRAPVAAVLGGIGDVVDALPGAVLWGLIGLAAIALALAGNAYWQSRRRTALEAQRAELLADVGLLSSALLPAVPAIEGLAVSAAYRPADGPAAGGDFYDVFELDAERIGVLLGDVSGHGRDAVTHAALARYTLRTLLAAGHGPGAALAMADRMLVRDLAPRFVTAIAAVFDRPRATLTYAKAGHQPPIVLGTDHDPGAGPPACPIGLALGECWPEFTLELDEATVVCLYTDGLEDARLGEARLGREEVLRLLAAQEAPDAARLIQDIGRRADHLSDDLTAVVLRAAPGVTAVAGGDRTAGRDFVPHAR